MFKSEASLFLSANNNVNCAKTIINECKRLIKDMQIQNNSDYTSCKNYIEGIDIDALVTRVEDTKESLFKLDQSFASEYMSLIQDALQNDTLNVENMTEEERFEYTIKMNAYARDYNYNLLYILEKYEVEGRLTPELKAQLEVQRAIVEQYGLKDDMAVLDPTSAEYIEMFKTSAEYDKKIINLNPNLTEEEKSEALKNYDENFNSNLEILELNHNISIKSDELEKLEYGSEEYYKKENEIRQLQIDFYDGKDLTEEQKKQRQFLLDCVEINNYYIAGDEDKARTKKTQTIDPSTGKCIATAGEIEYENADWWGRAWMDTKTVAGTFVTSLGGVGESIIDGTVMLTAGTVGLFNDDVAKWTEDFVSVNWSDDAYDGMVQSGGLNSYSAYSSYHTVTDMVTTTASYVGLSFIPGLGGSAVMAAAGGGSTAQTAFDNGASFKEAWGASAVSAGLAFAADVGMDKLNASNASLLLKTTGRTAIGVGEPLVNTIVEYAAYGHESGQSFHEYASSTGAYTNMVIGGTVANAAGLFSDYTKARSADGTIETTTKSSDYSGSNKVDGIDPSFEKMTTTKELTIRSSLQSRFPDYDLSSFSFDELKKMFPDEISDITRSQYKDIVLQSKKSWPDENGMAKVSAMRDYDAIHGDGAFDLLDPAQKGNLIDIAKSGMPSKGQNAFDELLEDYSNNVANKTIDTLESYKASGKIKAEFDVDDVLRMIEDDIDPTVYLTSDAVAEWKSSWLEGNTAPKGMVNTYVFQGEQSGAMSYKGSIGRAEGAFSMPESKFKWIMDPKNGIFDANGNCINRTALTEITGGVDFGSGGIVVIKQTIPEESLKMASGNLNGAFTGDWCPGGKTSGGIPEGITPHTEFANANTTRITDSSLEFTSDAVVNGQTYGVTTEISVYGAKGKVSISPKTGQEIYDIIKI